MLSGMSANDADFVSGADFNVAVIGAGPAGSAVAITVARRGFRVLLLDDDSHRTPKVGESLPPAASTVLQTLGVEAQLLITRHLLSSGIQSSWGSPFVRSTHFLRDPRGQGWHLDRATFDATLLGHASVQGAQVERNARVIHAKRTARAIWELTYLCAGESRTVTTPWVADCTGRQSWFASRQGAHRIHDDRLIAFVAFFPPHRADHPASIPMTTLIETVAHGWWYTVPLPKGGRVVVYLTDADSEQVRPASAKTGFLSLLKETHHVSQAVENHSSEIVLSATRANSSRLDRCWGPGWVAAGDASVSFDPLSSQGIFHALYSGIKAGEALLYGIRGDLSLFPSYEKRLQHIYSIYLAHRNEYYSLERRWPNSGFWRRRTGEPAMAKLLERCASDKI
jgi:flavin-dependent dehydrogenase